MFLLFNLCVVDRFRLFEDTMLVLRQGSRVMSPVSEHGFIGYSSGLLSSNTMPDYTPGENFFTVFGVFFPAATGEVCTLSSLFNLE